MTADGSGDPFAVDGERALDALTLAWADEYDEIWFHDGAGWGAHHKDAPDDDVITGSTPDELSGPQPQQNWTHGDISHEGHLGNDSTNGSEHDAPLSRQDLRRA